MRVVLIIFINTSLNHPLNPAVGERKKGETDRKRNTDRERETERARKQLDQKRGRALARVSLIFSYFLLILLTL